MLDERRWEELLDLMLAARQGRLGEQGEARLRWLVAKVQPNLQFRPLGEVYETGLLLVGLHSLSRGVASPGPAAPAAG